MQLNFSPFYLLWSHCIIWEWNKCCIKACLDIAKSVKDVPSMPNSFEQEFRLVKASLSCIANAIQCLRCSRHDYNVWNFCLIYELSWMQVLTTPSLFHKKILKIKSTIYYNEISMKSIIEILIKRRNQFIAVCCYRPYCGFLLKAARGHWDLKLS